MYGFINVVTLKEPITDAQLDRLRRSVVPDATREPGFRHYFALASDGGKAVATFHAWDTEAEGRAALEKIVPAVEEQLGDNIADIVRHTGTLRVEESRG